MQWLKESWGGKSLSVRRNELKQNFNNSLGLEATSAEVNYSESPKILRIFTPSAHKLSESFFLWISLLFNSTCFPEIHNFTFPSSAQHVERFIPFDNLISPQNISIFFFYFFTVIMNTLRFFSVKIFFFWTLNIFSCVFHSAPMSINFMFVILFSALGNFFSSTRSLVFRWKIFTRSQIDLSPVICYFFIFLHFSEVAVSRNRFSFSSFHLNFL